MRRKRIKDVLAEKEPKKSKWLDLTDLIRHDRDSDKSADIDGTECKVDLDSTIVRDPYGEPKLELILDSAVANTGLGSDAKKIIKKG